MATPSSSLLQPHPSHQPASIHTICTEILLILFETLDHTTATCLGLTCHSLYNLFKHIYPEKTSLMCSTTISTPGSARPRRRVFLYELLAPWIGHSYSFFPERWRPGKNSYFVTRMWRHCPPVFVSAKVYGSSFGAMEKHEWRRRMDLSSRWKDYKISKGRLPRPFGRGNEWYEEARLVIMEDVWRVEDQSA